MANTIMSAKNSFEQGLIMDFSPDNTQANCLTSALNATLLTFNGNEMQLQNDMGNGRVETAYLPEGYIPVGTCEFGDIVYIVSYNPLINKSQIGCFPSPERNISSEEIGDLQQSFKSSEFADSTTGEIKSKSVKKIIYGNTLNPGDKYIIYSSNIDNSKNTLSDYGVNGHNILPRLLKIHVVAIEESGKINYLDSSVKWYNNRYYISQNKIGSEGTDIDEYRDLVTSNYSIFQSKVSGKLALLAELESISTFNCSHAVRTSDVDNNRTFNVDFNVSWETDNININPDSILITNSNWPRSINGNLEYNTVNGNQQLSIDGLDFSPNFSSNGNEYYGAKLSRTYLPEAADSDKDLNSIIEESDYNTYRHILLAEEGEYYVNPDIYVYDGKENYGYKTILSSGKLSENFIQSEPINDDIVNNYFHKEITKSVIDFTIPYKKVIDKKTYYNDLSNFVWEYTIAPTMPYGILADLAVSGSIDFSKIGSGLIDLNEWRYYNDGNISTIKWGLEAYPEDNKKITKVVFEFYDNQGPVGTYTIKDKVSFSGSFTEVIQLGPEGVNPKLTSKDVDGDNIEHPGEAYILTAQELPTELGEVFFTKNMKDESGKTIYYSNDAGILYPNLVYLVKIYVFTAEIDALGNIKGEETKNNDPFVRFLWTNNLMNNYYYNTIDYVGIQPELTYSLDVSFKSNDSFDFPLPENDPEKYILNNQAKTPSDTTKVDNIVSTTLGGMKQIVGVKEGSEEDTNLKMGILPCLDDSYNTFTFNGEKLDKINYYIYFADQDIKYSPISLNFSEHEVTDVDLVMPPERTSEYVEGIQKNHDIDNLDDWFTLVPNQQSGTGDTTYQKIDGTTVTAKSVPYTTIQASEAIMDNGGVSLELKGQMVSRIAGSKYSEQSINTIMYKPVLATLEDFINYNMSVADPGNQSLAPITFSNCASVGITGDHNPQLLLGYASATEKYGQFSLESIDSRVRVRYSGEGFKNINLGLWFKENNFDFDNFSVVTFYSNSKDEKGDDKIEDIGGTGLKDDRDGHFDLRSNDSTTKNINQSWRDYWGTYKQSNYILKVPTGKNKSFDAGVMPFDAPNQSLTALIVKTSSDKYIMFNNFHRSSTYEDNISQRFSASIPQYGNLETFAQMIASLLVKVYYRSDNTESKKVYVTSNIVTCNDYTSTWTKDIITKVQYGNKDDGRGLLAMSGMDYDSYCDNLKINSQVGSWKIDENYCNNINILLNMNKVHTTQFQYDLKYRIDYLQKLYNTQEAKYYIEGDITGNYSGGFANTPPFGGNLGILQDNKEFVNLNQVKEVPLIQANKNDQGIIVITNNEKSKKVPLSKEIMNNLIIKDGRVLLRDFSYNRDASMYAIAGNSDDSRNDCSFALTKIPFIDDTYFKII